MVKMWITFGVLCCLAALTQSAEDHKNKPKEDSRGKRTLQYQIAHHYSGPYNYRSERRISNGPHFYQPQFHSGPRSYSSYYYKDGRYDLSKPLDDLQTEHNHLSEHSYYPPRAKIIEKPVYIKEPEPIIEIIIKESNVTLPPPPTPPPTPPPKKKKEQVHVFYVKYKKNPNGYGKDSIIYDKPIPAISPTSATEEEEEEPQPAYYPEPVVTQPPPPSTTLRTIIKPDSEVYHGPSGIKVTFGKESFDYHKRQSKPEDYNRPIEDVKFPSAQPESSFPAFPAQPQGRQLSFPTNAFDRQQNSFERQNPFDNRRPPFSPVPNIRPVSFPRQPQAYRPFSNTYKTPPATQFSRPQSGPSEYSTIPKSAYQSQPIQNKPPASFPSQLPFPQFNSQYSTLPQFDQPRKPVPYTPFENFKNSNSQKPREQIQFRPQHSFSSPPQIPEQPKLNQQSNIQPNPIPNYKTIPDIPPLKPQFTNFRDGPHIQHQPQQQFNDQSKFNQKPPQPTASHANFQTPQKQTFQSQQPQSVKQQFPSFQQQNQAQNQQQPKQPPKFSSNQVLNFPSIQLPSNFGQFQQQNTFQQIPQNSPTPNQFSQQYFNQIQPQTNSNGNSIQQDFHLNTFQQVQSLAPGGSQLIAAIPRFEQHISSVEPSPQQNQNAPSKSQGPQQNFYQQQQVAQSNIHKQTARPQQSVIGTPYNSNFNNLEEQYRQANQLQESIRNGVNFHSHIDNYSTQKPSSTYQTTQRTVSVTAKSTTTTPEPEKPSTTTKDPKILNAQLPDEVPDDLRQQLLSSGILNNADISVLDYDKVGDIPLSALPPDQLANFFNAGGAQQIAGSEQIPQYATKEGDILDKSFNEESDDDQEIAASESHEVREKPEVQMKVVHYDPLTEQGQQVQNSYVNQDAKQVKPVALNDDKYNRYLPLKVSGAQFPIPDVPELKGKKINSVVVLAPIHFDYKPSRSTRDAKKKDYDFVKDEDLRELLRNPTVENYKKFLENEAKRKSDQQAVILLVTGSEEVNREIFMYDVGNKTVSKLDGSLSAAFVKAAEENDTGPQDPTEEVSQAENSAIKKEQDKGASQPK
ncbi:uncharacterized protein LOC123308376 isoform X2 [Coccinella septempunctata]|uniref:uncharacterized protein LOC123308376 isoform X2 n=1 Tax=Coccinella septempunctata TaxID=41139 RepID=UPI001D07CE60|nr:uncharacterized protein LOC123308376 isoform X2 [Coccinella septempunctata]